MTNSTTPMSPSPRNPDFLLTWDKSLDDLRRILDLTFRLQALHDQGRSLNVFTSGLAISLFRDQSTRTRFSFASAASALGLTVADLDEKKSQLAHGETVRETATMISFLTEVIGIRDDLYLGAGHSYMVEVARALDQAVAEGVLPRRPALINLQCDLDHPTQTLSDLAHLVHTFGSVEALRGKKIAMTWAYSPSYGKPLSVPQGIIALMTRLGMDVHLAHPPGYDLVPDIVRRAREQAQASGGGFTLSHDLNAAFREADVVYPKSWAPYHIMEQRTELLKAGDTAGLEELEQAALQENARHTDWECTDEKLALTRGGEALYLHCLPADITGVSCDRGEVSASVFDRYRTRLYRQARYKPFVIAAMILAGRFADPLALVQDLADNAPPRYRKETRS
ncbi:MAG: knotted carbamoyltransferase YgeW [Candidatus Neomarinimicrobiota bacterium]|nr:MAG: knotted carbamoyltransferase YgeW [Candidatus Neomarinimicrobiota bacterium]